MALILRIADEFRVAMTSVGLFCLLLQYYGCTWDELKMLFLRRFSVKRGRMGWGLGSAIGWKVKSEVW